MNQGTAEDKMRSLVEAQQGEALAALDAIASRCQAARRQVENAGRVLVDDIARHAATVAELKSSQQIITDALDALEKKFEPAAPAEQLQAAE